MRENIKILSVVTIIIVYKFLGFLYPNVFFTSNGEYDVLLSPIIISLIVFSFFHQEGIRRYFSMVLIVIVFAFESGDVISRVIMLNRKGMYFHDISTEGELILWYVRYLLKELFLGTLAALVLYGSKVLVSKLIQGKGNTTMVTQSALSQSNLYHIKLQLILTFLISSVIVIWGTVVYNLIYGTSHKATVFWCWAPIKGDILLFICGLFSLCYNTSLPRHLSITLIFVPLVHVLASRADMIYFCILISIPLLILSIQLILYWKQYLSRKIKSA